MRRYTPTRSEETAEYASLFRPTLSRVSLLQLGNVDLGHLQHGLHDALRLCRVGVAHELHQRYRDDLPGQPVFVGEPAALLRCAAGRELVPEFVDFGLGCAVDEERDG